MVVREEQPAVLGNKRARVESEPDSPESKRVQLEPAELDWEKDDAGASFPEPDRIREDLLGILSDSDESTQDDSAIQDLDSVMKSLQDELTQPPETQFSPASVPDLGYLLEASDDELGLPPVSSSPEKVAPVTYSPEKLAPEISPEKVDFGQMFEFEDEFLPRYEYGIVDEDEFPTSGEVVLDELFPCEERRQPSDQTELTWQRELTRNPTALTG